MLTTVLDTETDSVEDPLSWYGYGSDGPMVNATHLFGLAASVVYAIVHNERVPVVFAQFFDGIPVQYTRRGNGQARLVHNMVMSTVASKTNRSMDDPLLLAAELSRSQVLVSDSLNHVHGCTRREPWQSPH